MNADEVQTNAQWMKALVAATVVKFDSLSPGDTLHLKEIEENPFNQLVRQALIQQLSSNQGIVIQVGTDTASAHSYRLEYHIAEMKVMFSGLSRKSLFKPKSFVRTAIFDVHLNLFRKGNSALLCSVRSHKNESQELHYADLQKTESQAYPQLNASIQNRIMPNLLDGIILLGVASCLIYFLYR